MTASALLRHGPEHAIVLLDGLCAWMKRKGFKTVDDLRGMLSVPSGTDAAATSGRICHRAAGRQRQRLPCVVNLEVQRPAHQ